MGVILFSCNDIPVGIFDDKKKFKTITFHYILDTLISAKLFKTKKECGITIKSNLKQMYSIDNFSFKYDDFKFTKVSMEMNNIVISIPKQYSSNTNFLFFRDTELDQPIPLLTLGELINL